MTTNNVVLFRKTVDTTDELEVAKTHFQVVEYRSQVPPNSLVIARYSALPYYRELEEDLKANGSRLLNSIRGHKWIADFDYYYELSRYTPRSWREYEMQHCDHHGPFVVKGATNSRKHKWNTHMFAPDKKTALLIGSELASDDLVGPQGIIYREYVPLKTFEIGVNGLPFSNEWRIFYYKGHRLTYGYYWTLADNPKLANLDKQGLDLADEIAQKVAEHVDFYVIDMAQRDTGEWVMIELNDAQMAGLSFNDPHVLYANLVRALDEETQKG